ncbi:phosphoribosyltransferase family protein [Clostridium sp. D2Q-11]|uniref:Phosphoribosyltransferase family protein n=1 Tax=Anaeromonas frigoriresistens TaxID=2683708 RepID=A0A942Z7G1_9FIRM|nr:phosphoribosyltransferase family protein [Anaeromonas frigoriresistens]MBS4536930.1 phosphoribosyltransferase family protein [Anaeromonas frigoriresistens]
MENEIKYNVLDNLKIKLSIDNNKFNILPEELFLIAARKNKKRSFLFVSKVLGKHIPVDPKLSLLVGKLLGNEYIKQILGVESKSTEDIVKALNKKENIDKVYDKAFNYLDDLPEKTLFIGFAETATALGHSVFSSFKSNAYYIHTTREEILEYKNPIKFQEEHSHATGHNLYPVDFDILSSKAPIVFVDDEITTGKTTLNIIEAIHKKYPRKNYTIISILDWRKQEDKQRFKEVEDKLKININTISLLSGNIKIEEDRLSDLEIKNNVRNIITKDLNIETVYLDLKSQSSIKKNKSYKPYLKCSAIFGLDCEDNKLINEELIETGEYLNSHIRKGNNTLCMGTGEFMYIPMLLSTQLGYGVSFQSTTRSPIYPEDKRGYGVRNVFKFNSLDGKKIENYFYNVPIGHYDEIFLFLDREFPEQQMNSLINVLRGLGIKYLNIVIFSKKGERAWELNQTK